jgi:hypothetical protein
MPRLRRGGDTPDPPAFPHPPRREGGSDELEWDGPVASTTGDPCGPTSPEGRTTKGAEAKGGINVAVHGGRNHSGNRTRAFPQHLAMPVTASSTAYRIPVKCDRLSLDVKPRPTREVRLAPIAGGRFKGMT